MQTSFVSYFSERGCRDPLSHIALIAHAVRQGIWYKRGQSRHNLFTDHAARYH